MHGCRCKSASSMSCCSLAGHTAHVPTGQKGLVNALLLKLFPPLSTRRNFLKLTTMYKIIGNFSYFPPGVFVQHNFPYSTNQHTNFSRPFARTQYMFSSFVPSVITLWNALPNSVKHASSISVFKRLLHSM